MRNTESEVGSVEMLRNTSKTCGVVIKLAGGGGP